MSRRLRWSNMLDRLGFSVEPMDAAEEEQLRVDVARWTQEFIEDKLTDEDNPQADFKIRNEDREELGDAITRAGDAYWGPDSGAHRRALAGLDKHLWRVVESLTVLRFWLTDEITARAPPAFGSGRDVVETQLNATVGRLIAVGQLIADDELGRVATGSMAAATDVLLGFWRGTLGRKVQFDHNPWKKGHPPPRDNRKRLTGVADRADLFVYDIMVHVVGEDAADEVREALKSRTDKALEKATKARAGRAPERHPGVP